MGAGYGGGANVRYGGAGDAEIAWEQATDMIGGYGEVRCGWRCRNSMGGGFMDEIGGYGGLSGVKGFGVKGFWCKFCLA